MSKSVDTTKVLKRPASVAVYIKTKEDIIFLRFSGKNHKHKQPLLRAVALYLVMEKTETDTHYPFNILRKITIEAAKGECAVLLDVDSIPMPEGCHDLLVAALKNLFSDLIINKK